MPKKKNWDHVTVVEIFDENVLVHPIVSEAVESAYPAHPEYKVQRGRPRKTYDASQSRKHIWMLGLGDSDGIRKVYKIRIYKNKASNRWAARIYYTSGISRTIAI